MARVCVTTVVSADHYQWYIPTFIYSWRRAYPEYYVQIFVKGKLSKKLHSALKALRTIPRCEEGWAVQDNAFKKYPKATSMCNALRHVLPEKQFKHVDYIYITDVDFIAFRHKKSHLDYFKIEMDKTKQPYAGFRGPERGIRRTTVAPLGWTGAFTRISSGNLMLNAPKWFKRTRKARRRYAKILRGEAREHEDNVKPASYREYDEVMLCRICKQSGLKVPRMPGHTVTGKPFNRLYRDVHLGDYKFAKRVRKHGKKLVHPDNTKAFRRLDTDPDWQRVMKLAANNTIVRRNLHNAKKQLLHV